jgi:hypothetical protein
LARVQEKEFPGPDDPDEVDPGSGGEMGRTRKIQEASEGVTPAKTQREILREVLPSATECGSWLSLNQLPKMASHAQARISAQLRPLRKQQYGDWAIDKRCNEVEETRCAINRDRNNRYHQSLDRSSSLVCLPPSACHRGGGGTPGAPHAGVACAPWVSRWPPHTLLLRVLLGFSLGGWGFSPGEWSRQQWDLAPEVSYL